MRGPIDSAIRWWRHTETSRPGEKQNGKEGRHGLLEGSSGTIDLKVDPESLPAVLPERTADGSPPPSAQAVPPVFSHESPWLARLDEAGVPRTLVYPSTTLGRMLDQTAERFADATAIVYAEKSWTYRELIAEVNRLAGGLARMGVRRGERVVLTLPNCPEYIFCFFAIQKLGAVVINAGPLMGADDLQTVLTMTAPRVVIGLDLQAPLLGRVGKDSTVEHWVWVSLAFYQTVFKRLGYQLKVWHEREKPGDSAHHLTFSALMQDAPSRPPTVDPDPRATAVLQPTGGTTGGVRLVQLSHYNLLCNAQQISVWMNARLGQERTLAVLPMFHVYGLTTCLINAIFDGGQVLLLTRFDAEAVLQMIERHQPTTFPLVPAICDALSDRIERESLATPLASVRLCISGAAPLPQATAGRFERLGGTRVIEGYGLSESAPVTHVNLPGKSRYGSIGLPMPDTLCRIVEVGETGDGAEKRREPRDMPAGEAGELLISGPQVMAGYFANPAQTAKSLITDPAGRTWLRTGDIARVDAEGFFHIVDRKKDMIIRSGMKVYPAKVEAALRLHDRVADAGVIGRPDPVHTEEVVAFVVARGELSDRDALTQEIRSFCRLHLAPYEVPAKVEFIDKLPRSALGKLLKRELRLREVSSPASPAVTDAPPPLALSASINGKPTDNGHDPDGSKGSNGIM